MEQTHSSAQWRAENALLMNALTLIALGVSILFLNSWDNLVVRLAVGIFWGAFLMVQHGPDALRTFRTLQRFKRKHDTARRASHLAAS